MGFIVLGEICVVRAATHTSGDITVHEYDMEHVHATFPTWATFDKEAKRAKLQEIEPTNVQSTTNTTCTQGHRWAVDALDASQPSTPPVRLLAVGRSNTSPSESDLSLNDEVARIDTTGYDDTGESLTVTSVIDAQEANVDVSSGEALREVGLYAGGINGEPTYFLNHSLLSSPIDKDSSITATVSVTLTYSAV